MIRNCTCKRAKHQHGTWVAYANDKCRCQPCRDAWAYYHRHKRYQRERGQKSFVPHVGTARRLQALAAVGWSLPDIAERLGYASDTILREWRAGNTAGVRPATARKIAAVYDEVWDKPPPGRYPVKVRNIAARNGWPPPLAWDDATIDDPDATPEGIFTTSSIDHNGYDEIAIERIIAGTLNVGPIVTRPGTYQAGQYGPELVEAVRRMHQHHGMSDGQIGERIGRTKDAVLKIRARNGISREVAA